MKSFLVFVVIVVMSTNLSAQLPKVLQDDIAESYNWILDVAKSSTCKTAQPMKAEDINETPLETCNFIDTFKMFPNPAKDALTIVFTGAQRPTQILINGLDGKTHYTQNVKEFDGFYNQSINIDYVPAGLYIFSIVQGKEVFNKKLLIQ